jgi:uncharacterized integral membrane protein
MKNVKIAFWVIIVGFIILFLFQNQDVIIEKQSFKLDLMVADEYHTPELPNGIIYFICLLTGFFIAFFAALSDRFKFKKNVKNLQITNDSQLEEISVLKSRLELLQGVSSRPDETVVENAEVTAEDQRIKD